MESVYFKVVVIKTYVVLCRVKSCGVENVSIFATCHDMSALKWQKCPIFGFATKTCQTCPTCPLFSVSITPALMFPWSLSCTVTFFDRIVCFDCVNIFDWYILWMKILSQNTSVKFSTQQTLN
jgi:hypothetical protein